MRKIALLLLLAIAITQSNCRSQDNMSYKLLIGTYTENSDSAGIYVYDFDAATGGLIFNSSVSGTENPSYLAVGGEGRYVYAVNEVNDGRVSSFAFDYSSGELTFLKSVSSGGSRPAYISTDGNDKFIFVANYGSGSLSAIPLNIDGTPGEDIQTIQHEGSSIHPRQKGPHVHCVIPSPDSRFLLAADLGTDNIFIYKINDDSKGEYLIPAEAENYRDVPGNGPRHITFHPNGKIAYLISELGGNVTVFDYHNGNLSAKQKVSLVPDGFTGSISAADIHVSADGRFLYASNRGDANEIVIYSISANGELAFMSRQSVLGSKPRNFVIDPTGSFLLVANQDTKEVVVFRIDKHTGLITPTGSKIDVTSPVCLKFI